MAERSGVTPLFELRGITKRFGTLVADDHVDLTVLPGEVHALVGENGAGKTTLMNIAFGLLQPDSGSILMDGRPVQMQSPIDARRHRIGMVHQHFKLVPSLTVAENIFLGQEPTHGLALDRAEAIRRVEELAHRFHLAINPRARVSTLSLGLRQRIEILKAISNDAHLLILDEPTAVLTPEEIQQLFHFIRNFVADGRAVIFITHKLREVKEVTDRFTVIRDGRNVITLPTAEADEADIARLMVGREVLLRVEHTAAHPGPEVLRVESVSALDDQGLQAVTDVSLHVRAGEIVGVAGVEGNGQSELIDVITGLRPVQSGRIMLGDRDITRASVAARRAAGVAHVPEDRIERGTAGGMSIEENIAGDYLDRGLSAFGVLRSGAIRQFARYLIRRYDVRGARPGAIIRSLSGGNMQKVVLAREMEQEPRLLVAAQPTRGVDIGATEFVHNALLKQRDRGTAVLLISADLNEIRSISDRVLVMYRGRIAGEFPPDASDTEIGLAMAGGSSRAEISSPPVAAVEDVSPIGAPPPSDPRAVHPPAQPPLPGERQGLANLLRNVLTAMAQPALAIVIALVIGFILVTAIGQNAAVAYKAFLLGSFESQQNFGNMLATMTPLLLAAISVMFSFRAGVFNIGAEGQIYLGAFAAAWFGFTFSTLPGPAIVVGAMVSGALAGALWAFLPAILLARWQVGEIVTTLMLNYIAMNITDYLVNNTFKDVQAGAPETAMIPFTAWLPLIIPGSTAHAGLLVALVVAVLSAFILFRTSWGLRLRFTGENPRFASYLGISVPWTIVQVMVVSGVVAGIAGALDVLGADHRFIQGFSPGYGFLGLTVALLGRLNPWGIVAAALVYASLSEGAQIMEIQTSVPYPLVNILQGIIVLLMTATGLLAWRRRFSSGARPELPVPREPEVLPADRATV